MRLQCSSCRQSFYLEAKNPVPCPACGGTLSAAGDHEAAAPPPPQPSDTQQLDVALAGLFADADEVVAKTGMSLPTAQTQAPPQVSPQLQQQLQEQLQQQMQQPPAPQQPFTGQAQPGLMPGLENAPGPGALTTGFPTTDWGAAQAEAQQPRKMLTYYIIGLSATVVLLIGMVIAFALSGGSDDETDAPTKPPIKIAGGGTDPTPGDQKPTDTKSPATDAEPSDPGSDTDASKPDVADATPDDGGEKKPDEGEGEGESEVEALRRQLLEMQKREQQQARVGGLMLKATNAIDVQNDPAAALSHVDAAIAIDPANADARRIRGRSLARLGRVEDALIEFDRAGDAESLCRGAELAQHVSHDNKRAMGYLERAQSTEEASPYVAYARARHLFLRGAYDGARKEVDKLRVADGSFARAVALFGEIEYRRALVASTDDREDHIADADEALEDAVKLDPGLAFAFLLRARLLILTGDATDSFGLAGFANLVVAEELLKRTAAIMPRWAEVHVALGGLYLEQGSLHNTAAGVDHARLAVELTDRKDAPALALLAEALSCNGDPGKAAEVIIEAIRLKPETDAYHKARDRYTTEKKQRRPDEK